MAAAAAEQRHASAGLAQDLSSLQPPNLLRTMAADGGLDDIPDPTAMTDSQRARMAEELIQRTLAEPSLKRTNGGRGVRWYTPFPLYC